MPESRETSAAEASAAEAATVEADDVTTPAELPIVGIGASAGGLAALRQFFSLMPSDTGIAFVVVVHLSPEHKSYLAEALQPGIDLPIQQVTGTVKLEPNKIYVIPPNANLSAVDTHLRLSELEKVRICRAPIDHFFRTLAVHHHANAIGVILTGTGNDGTLGIRQIKERGGLTIVQSPNDAECDGMPQSAISTGIVDLVLPLRDIPRAIRDYLAVKPGLPVGEHKEQREEGEFVQVLNQIFSHLRARSGRDFSRYKRSTLLRRIQRRMQLKRIEQLSNYLKLLREDPNETKVLGNDLLITVSNFFRDPEVFTEIEKNVIPKLFEGKDAEREIRIWIVGCSTGEEAYSYAMLLAEEASRRDSAPKLQVFASDLHELSLARAREGFYPGDIAADVSPERLKRFFIKENSGYRVRKELREMIVFAPHNLLGDPPFSRIDLISCRNLLIYLQRAAQKDVIELFHYALCSGGFLVLGNSETIEGTDLFRAEHKKYKVFSKRDVPAPEPRLPVFPTSGMRHVGAHEGFSRKQDTSFGALHSKLAEQYTPPSVLVSPDDKLVHLSENAGRYLLLPGGDLTTSIYKLVREELLVEFRSCLKVAREENRIVESHPVRVHFGTEQADITLSVSPSTDRQHDGYALVVFEEVPVGVQKKEVKQARNKSKRLRLLSAPSDSREHELEDELRLSEQRLQLVIEEYETSREEMKAANEELQSTNEELRSTLEELETSKEELQSINEELQALDEENRSKVLELAQLSGDLQNLLAATDIATLFLDRHLRIMRFTPQVSHLFRVRATDRGRPIADLTHKLGYDSLVEDSEKVLTSLIPVEREVQDEQGDWYLVRILPYRSAEERIEGVVLTFVDISLHKINEEALRQSEVRLEAELISTKRLFELSTTLQNCPSVQSALDVVLEAILEITGAQFGLVQLYEPERQVLNLAAARNLVPEYCEKIASQPIDQIDTPSAQAIRTKKRVVILNQPTALLKGAEEIDQVSCRSLQATPLVSKKGDPLGVLSTFYAEERNFSNHELTLLDLYAQQAADFLERKRADELQQLLIAELDHRVKNSLATVLSLAKQTLRNTSSLDEFRESYLGRLCALADAHRLITGHRWKGVSLATLVESALKPYSQPKGPKVEIRGKDILLNSKLSQAIYLVLHELTTNAVKYGALSADSGSVHVSWSIQENQSNTVLLFSWKESGGPEVVLPKEAGFGTQLIERTVVYELGGQSALEFHSEGLECQLTIPISG